MPDESTYRRRLKEGEPSEPTQAWIETADGLRIDCELTRQGPLRWTARPPAPYRVEPGDRFRLDRLPAKSSVVFENVIGPDSPDSE